MHIRIIFWSVIIIFACMNSGAAELKFKLEPAPEYDALFRNTRGWIGADGDFTVSLGSSRLLWLFSDTFVGEVKDGRRVNSTMINNSIAIGRLGAKQQVEFYYPTGSDGKPKSFITPDSGHGYFWLFDGALTSKGLYIFLMHIEHVDNDTGFPFRQIGASFGHISNPSDSPSKWIISQRKFPYCKIESDGSIFFGSAIMVDGGYAYIYGLDGRKKNGKQTSGMILARTSLDDFGDFTAWRFYSNGKWEKDFDKCTALCNGMATEYSVCYVPAIKQYTAIYTSMGISGQIVMRLAPKPEGPWGEPVMLYDCPDKQWHEKTYSYAAKAHPELSKSPNELIISYATNSTHFPDLFDDARLYWPRFVRVIFSPSGT